MELIAASVILVNLVGYMLGVYGAKLISMFTDSELLTHAASTFITTELLGWGVYGFLGMFRRTQTASEGSISAPPQKQHRQRARDLARRGHRRDPHFPHAAHPVILRRRL